MKLEKALKILTINNEHNPNYNDADREEAHQLGIEAIKYMLTQRVLHPVPVSQLLPHETK